MEEFELRNQILLGEDSTRQFKREPSADAKMAGEIVAFANSGGGRIFIGVEKDGTIAGLTGEEAEKVGEDMAKVAWDSVRPPFSILSKSIPTGDGIVVVIEIPDGASKPYCDNKGVYWVKNGPDKRRVQSPEELARLFQSGEKLYAESQVVAASTLEDFDHERFKRFYETKYSETPPSRSEEREAYQRTLENLELVDSGRVTVAGLLLFGKRLPVLLPEMKMDAIWFQGSERASSEWHDQRTITGTLAEQYDEGMGFLKRWNARVQGEGSFNQTGRLKVPETVFEELLVNALIHRDYFIKDSIKVFIFDDRIEIRSPGKLPNSLTVNQIRRGVRRSRNVLLASFAPDLLHFRGIGSGIVRALKAWPSLSWVNDAESEEVMVTIELTPTAPTA
ncbi:RNA-binding domain-containing protein [Candidatus Symbiobacter mobilis]|uniref:RecG-like helicase n=1 Tax=Candidatus Symbiobacter mobilis CR TaxID=946483 RepID=U5N5N1_9BURK|nr:RNA-binding domain-containing protein [Candidatus Symbiobacter mobilis]AGX86821.1 RecG-like helicase [Candidatus Symbiobacter mobilis CR]